MKHTTTRTSRRAVLRGIGGVSLGLPLLDVLSPRKASAAPPHGDFAIFNVHCNGVMQLHTGRREPETFWPRAVGPLTPAIMAADLAAKRSTGELSAYADRLLIVKGITAPFPSNGDGHNGGDAQILTAQRHVNSPHPYAFGESVDNRMAREKNPAGREPLVVRVVSGTKNIGAVSYRGRDDQRFGDDNPQAIYDRMVGLTVAQPGLGEMIQKKRLSVNDLLRSEIKRVLGRSDLSMADRQRLDTHFSAIRQIEGTLQGTLAPEAVTRVKDVAAGAKYNSTMYVEPTWTVQLELMAFAIASGYTKVAVLKMGNRTDNYRWSFPGFPTHPFHHLSHRIESGGASGPPIPTAYDQHHLVDRLYLRKWKWYLDHLSSWQTPTGPLLDQGFAAWTNQIAVGTHGYTNLPWIIAGKAKGYFRPGRFVQESGQRGTLNQLHNTFLGALGVTKAGGAPVDDFGAPEGLKGQLTDLLSPG